MTSSAVRVRLLAPAATVLLKAIVPEPAFNVVEVPTVTGLMPVKVMLLLLVVMLALRVVGALKVREALSNPWINPLTAIVPPAMGL